MNKLNELNTEELTNVKTLGEAEIKEITVTDKDPAEVVAKRVVDLIQQGKTPQEAAQIIGIHPGNITGSPTMQLLIRNLLAEAYIGPEIVRAMLRAGRNKAFAQTLTDGLRDNDTGLLKIAAEFSKQIGNDPEIGLSQAPQQIVNIDITELKDVLKHTEPLLGFDAPDFEDKENG